MYVLTVFPSVLWNFISLDCSLNSSFQLSLKWTAFTRTRVVFFSISSKITHKGRKASKGNILGNLTKELAYFSLCGYLHPVIDKFGRLFGASIGPEIPALGQVLNIQYVLECAQDFCLEFWRNEYLICTFKVAALENKTFICTYLIWNIHQVITLYE